MDFKKVNWFRHVIGFIGLSIFLAMGSLAYYLGAFKEVDVRIDVHGPFFLIYKEHRGPYHKIVSVLEEIENWVKTQDSYCELTYGEYLDDPNSQEESRLRSRGGCLFKFDLPDSLKTKLTGQETSSLREPTTSTPDSLKKLESELKQIQEKLPPGYIIEYIPQQKYIMAIFEGSPGIGPLKVYPKIDEFVSTHNIKRKPSTFEIYKIDKTKQNAMTTTYLVPTQI